MVFTNIEVPAGKLYIAVFDSQDAFLHPEKARFQGIFPVDRLGSQKVVIKDVPAGTYALSCFHDVNNNGILDKNWMGIPKEPYCFSNNARPRFRAPTWEEAKFAFRSQSLSLHLEKW